MIKAIETVYNGYRFRSRLEARWAVFFKSMGFEYRYEPEGFDLSGIRYLPDFYLPQLKCWIEIKPSLPSVDDREKAIRLCLASQESVFFLSGEPSIDVTGYLFYPMNGSIIKAANSHRKIKENLYWITQSEFFHIQKTRESEVDDTPIGGDVERQYIWSYAWFSECSHCHSLGIHAISCINGCEGTYETDTPRLIKAYTAARQARFEHGEKP